MNNIDNELINMNENIGNLKNDINANLVAENLRDLNSSASNKDPSDFYSELQTYREKSNIILSEFYTQLENDNKIQYETKIKDIDMNTYINYDCLDRKVSDGTGCINDMLKEINYNGDTVEILKMLRLKYQILQNEINVLKANIITERDNLDKTINDKRNDELFASTLNSDYSEIYKYKYLRNWGIFFSIIGGAYFFKKMK